MSEYILYNYKSKSNYIGRTYQSLDTRITGHINDALKGSERYICRQITHDLKTKGEKYVRRSFKVINNVSKSHDDLCTLETSYIRAYQPRLNMTKPKTRVTKVVRKPMIKQPPMILKKHEKKYIQNKPRQTQSLIHKASHDHTFENKQERLRLIKRISNQYPDWD